MMSIDALGGHRFLLECGQLVLLSMVLTACLASGQSVDGTLEDERGKASYYADKFEGRTTASGEVYDPEALTAAHPHLPFGTRVRVTRLDGESTPSVEVRINDRGPFREGRIIDLSRAAAQKLGMLQEGVVQVRVELIEEVEGEEQERNGRGEETSWR